MAEPIVYLTNYGRKVVQHLVQQDATYTTPVYVGWGTGTGAQNDTRTDLITPASEARVAGTTSVVTTDVTDDTYQNVATLTCEGSAKVITESGVFMDASGATLFLHAIFDDLSLQPGDSIQLTHLWQLL